MAETGVNQDATKVREWLEDLIVGFRDRYEKLDELEKKSVNNSFDYRQPTQVELFWLLEPLENQIVVTKHDSERSDKEIVINGPYKGYELVDEVEKVMKDPRWTKEVPILPPFDLPDGRKFTYSDAFAGALGAAMINIRSSVFLEPRQGCQEGTIFPPDGWCWRVAGSVISIDLKKMLQDFVNQTRSTAATIAKEKQKGTPTFSALEKSKGFGTHFYPPVWIGKMPEKSFKQKVSGSQILFGSKVFDQKIGGIDLIFQSDGFIGVKTDLHSEALRILNTVFGVALIIGEQCSAVTESEMAEIEIEPRTLNISSTSMRPRTMRTLLGAWEKPLGLLLTTREISEEKISKIIRIAERVLNSEGLADQLIFLLEGFTYHTNSEYSQSFIMDWLIVEKYISSLWSELLAQRRVFGKRMGKLRNTNLWTADSMLETLSLSGKLSDEEYELLMDLKNKRNNFIHRGDTIDGKTSQTLLDIAFGTLKKKLAGTLEP